MNLGVLQQVGPPLELYNRPANTFVAGFVGSTRINFLPAEKVPVGAPASANGNALDLAIRPEYIDDRRRRGAARRRSGRR